MRRVRRYVQEVGRAGRDGEEALCHVFVDTKDYVKLRGFAYGEVVDAVKISTFVQHLWGVGMKKAETDGRLAAAMRRGFEATSSTRVLVMDKMEAAMDMKADSIATILTGLDMFERPPIRHVYRHVHRHSR